MDRLPSDKAADLPIRHYEIASLYEIAGRPGLDSELAMWYPQTMFRLLNDPEHEQQRRLIMLMGSTAAGKSILSAMAGAPTTHNRGQHLFLPQSYFAVGSDNGAPPAKEILQRRLYSATQLDAQDQNFLDLPPTEAPYSFVSAIFLRDKEKPGLLRKIGRLLGDAVSGGFQPDGPSSANHFRLLLLYDFAGERFDLYQAAQLQGRLQLMTHAAVLLDATSLKRFNPATAFESARIARQRLDNIPPDGVEPCLVVTKIDKIQDRLSSSDRQYIQNLEHDPNLPRTNAENEVLRRWLDTSCPWEPELKGFLEKNPELPVFFVWSLNLHGGGAPCSIGLQRFLLWAAGFRDRPHAGSASAVRWPAALKAIVGQRS
jgi:hypothetical protein